MRAHTWYMYNIIYCQTPTFLPLPWYWWHTFTAPNAFNYRDNFDIENCLFCISRLHASPPRRSIQFDFKSNSKSKSSRVTWRLMFAASEIECGVSVCRPIIPTLFLYFLYFFGNDWRRSSSNTCNALDVCSFRLHIFSWSPFFSHALHAALRLR